MKAVLFALLLLALTCPCAAVKRHRRHRYRDEHIRYPMPRLAEMKRRFAWVQAKNRAEQFPRWRYAGKGLAKR